MSKRQLRRPFGNDPTRIQDALEATLKKLCTQVERRRRYLNGDPGYQGVPLSSYYVHELGRTIEMLAGIPLP